MATVDSELEENELMVVITTFDTLKEASHYLEGFNLVRTKTENTGFYTFGLRTTRDNKCELLGYCDTTDLKLDYLTFKMFCVGIFITLKTFSRFGGNTRG